MDKIRLSIDLKTLSTFSLEGFFYEYSITFHKFMLSN